MAAAKYLVTVPPGAPVHTVGFVRQGEIFTAPSPEYVPSRTFRPVNEEARVALAKLRDQLRRKADASTRRLAEEVNLDVIRVAVSEAKIQPGLSDEQLAELSREAEAKKTRAADGGAGELDRAAPGDPAGEPRNTRSADQ